MEEKKTVFEVTRSGLDFEVYIPENTLGQDIEFGLAVMIKNIAEFQKQYDATFNSTALLRRIEQWVQQLEDRQ